MPYETMAGADAERRDVVIGIVVVTHNHSGDIASCLSALESAGATSHGVVVVRDCDSGDGTADLAEAHPLPCTVIRGQNVGFGQACNEGVRALPADVTHLLLLNPDTQVQFSFEALCEVISSHPNLRSNFGCAGLRQVDPRGRLVWSWDYFPSVGLEWQKAIGRPLLQRSKAGYTHDREVDWVMGALLIVPRPVFQAYGGFDPRYFLFYEEIDFCRRLRAGGLRVVYLNGLTYRHRQDGKATVWREVLRLNSRRAYDRRWLSRAQTLDCQCAQTVRWFRTLVLPSLRAERRFAPARLLATWGLLHAVTDRPGRGELRAGRRG